MVQMISGNKPKHLSVIEDKVVAALNSPEVKAAKATTALSKHGFHIYRMTLLDYGTHSCKKLLIDTL
jgi:hypothetical protein